MKKKKNDDLALIRSWRKSPLNFIKDVFNLTPERTNSDFRLGSHITWQQEQILLAVERALNGSGPKRISVAAGHGLGKTATISWLLLWYLYCFRESQVGCTAPSSDQLYDVLWKEANKWLNKMPEIMQKKFIWQADHIRITEAPELWFARAKTAKKETPEALAGLHGKYVMLLGDEAAGIPEEIYNTAEGSLTDTNILAILISNPTRLTGYFYETHHRDKAAWKTLQFNSMDSPLVNTEFNQRIIDKHGFDSDEYRVRVLGQFPREDMMDESGYVPLFPADLKFIGDVYEFRSVITGDKVLGIDPAGEGRDKTVWVIRDNYVIKKIAEEATSTPKSIALKTITLMDYYGIKPELTFIDGFGVGATAAREIFAASQAYAIRVILTSEKSDETHLNLRAKLGMDFANWCNSGGKLVQDKCWEELHQIKYRRNLSGKIQIMDKLTMRKIMGKSPDYFDAAALTFCQDTMPPSAEATQYRPKVVYGRK